LAGSARRLLDSGEPERWWMVAVIRPELDTNVPLLPGTAAAGTAMSGADADLSVLAAATARPFEHSTLALDEALSYRRQERLTDFDLLGNVAGATYPYVDTSNRASVAYHFEASALGGARYATGHVVDAAYRRALGDEFGAAARYTFAARDFAPDTYAGYTGASHTGVVELSWGTTDQPFELAVGYVVTREVTADSALSATAQGARAALRLSPWHGADLRITAAAADRIYDAAAMGRRDLQGRADAALLLDLTERVGVVVGGSWLRNASTDATFDYTKWTAFAGLVAVVSS
jgi:hypothetical protein